MRCLASPRHALLAESLGKPSLWVNINDLWYLAQYALGALLALALMFPVYARDTAARRWAPEPVASIAGKTALVAGLGPNGRAR